MFFKTLKHLFFKQGQTDQKQPDWRQPEQEQPEPSVGQRVFYHGWSKETAALGTILDIEQSPDGTEYWDVRDDYGLRHREPSTNFEVYDGPEFQVGDTVRHHYDEGGYLEAVVLRPVWAINHVRFLIRAKKGEEEFSARPHRLKKV